MSNWEILWSSRDVFWQGFGNTVTIFVISAIAAFLLGSLLVFMMEGARPRLKTPLRIFIDGMRMLPFLILAYLFYYGLPSLEIRLSAWQAGVSALILYHGAYFAEILRGSRVTLSSGQEEAATALGFSRPSMFIRIMLPQTVITSLPNLVNEMSFLVKGSPAIAVIGIVDLTRVTNRISAVTYDPLPPILAAALLYMAIIGFLVWGQRIAERKANRLAM